MDGNSFFSIFNFIISFHGGEFSLEHNIRKDLVRGIIHDLLTDFTFPQTSFFKTAKNQVSMNSHSFKHAVSTNAEPLI